MHAQPTIVASRDSLFSRVNTMEVTLACNFVSKSPVRLQNPCKLVKTRKHARNKTTCLQSSGNSAPPTSTVVKRNALGWSNLQVSEICFGCMMFGSQTDERTAHRILDHAFEAGVDFLDTAEMYSIPTGPENVGRSSEIVGSWMKHKDRSKVVIATKVVGRSGSMGWVTANRTVPKGKAVPPRVDAKSIKAAVEGELRRLQTDYLDVLQIHWPDRYVPLFGAHQYDKDKEFDDVVSFEEQVEAMGQLIAQGKIRHWGLSNETPFGTTMHCTTADRLNVPRPITIQNSYSLLDRNFDSGLAETCAPSNFNIGLLPWCAAGAGALSGKYLGGNRPSGARLSMYDNVYVRFVSDRSLRAVEEYVNLAGEVGITPQQLAYAFCKSRWFIPSTIIGATSLEQVDENVAAFGVELSQDVLDAIDEIHVRRSNPQNMD